MSIKSFARDLLKQDINITTTASRMFEFPYNVTTDKRVLSCGIKRQPPQLIFKYEYLGKKKLHVINLKCFIDCKSISARLQDIYVKPHHTEFLGQVPKAQIVRLISILKDLCKGIPLKRSLEINDGLDTILSDEDLNKADDDVLERWVKYIIR